MILMPVMVIFFCITMVLFLIMDLPPFQEQTDFIITMGLHGILVATHLIRMLIYSVIMEPILLHTTWEEPRM